MVYVCSVLFNWTDKLKRVITGIKRMKHWQRTLNLKPLNYLQIQGISPLLKAV